MSAITHSSGSPERQERPKGSQPFGAEQGAGEDGLEQHVGVMPQDLVEAANSVPLMILPENATVGDAIHELAKGTPKNEHGIPLYIYRADMIPQPLSQLRRDDADVAIVNLDFSEGYPTLPNSSIFWYQLPAEPFDAHQLFMRYLDQAEELGLRQLQILSMDQRVSLERIAELKKTYYWSARARAYDIFKVAAERRRRELRARSTEDKHYQNAATLISQIQAKFQEPDWIEKVSPEDAMKMMIDLMKVQRISLGLSATGSTKDIATDPYMAADNEQLIQEVTRGLQANSDNKGMSDQLQALLANPNMALMAQTLIFQARRNDVDTEMAERNLRNVTPPKPGKVIEDDA